MRLVVVGLSPSIHLAKAISMLSGLDWDVHVVAAADLPWIDDFDNCTIHHRSRMYAPLAETRTRRVVVHPPHVPPGGDLRAGAAAMLAELIDELRPDIVHSQEFQQGAYLTLEARRRCRKAFPPWIVSNWGSDIYFYARDAVDRAVVREVLAHADGYWAECVRDVALARAEGFRGITLPVLPIAGGYDLAAVRALRAPGPTSKRTAIAVKGYQHRLGRALNALDAVDMCGDLLEGRELILYAVSSESVGEMASQIAALHGARLTMMPRVPYDEILRMQGRARVALGVSMSDGISTSFLEALLGGSFPVQSSTGCAREWVVDGEGGLLVDPTDVAAIARSLRRALTDDALVDRATLENDRVIEARLDAGAIRAATIAGYRRVVAARASNVMTGAES
ncbi:MAG: glycosyltransferase [Thermoanaerobaculia bacterium]